MRDCLSFGVSVESSLLSDETVCLDCIGGMRFHNLLGDKDTLALIEIAKLLIGLGLGKMVKHGKKYTYIFKRTEENSLSISIIIIVVVLF